MSSVPLIFAVGIEALYEEMTELISEIAELIVEEIAEGIVEIPEVMLLEMLLEACVVGTLEIKVEAEVETAVVEALDFASASVTGQMVVPTEMTSVVTAPSLPGQSLTVGAHEVIV